MSFHFSRLPEDVKAEILAYIPEGMPVNNQEEALKSYAKPLAALALVSEDFSPFNQELSVATKKFKLIQKYSRYQEKYEAQCEKEEAKGNLSPVASPYLCDALSSGLFSNSSSGYLNHAQPSVKFSNGGPEWQRKERIESLNQDISDMIDLMPEGVNYTLSNYISKQPKGPQASAYRANLESIPKKSTSSRQPLSRKKPLHSATPTSVRTDHYSALDLACINPHVSLKNVEKILLKTIEFKELNLNQAETLLANLENKVQPERLEAIQEILKRHFFKMSGANLIMAANQKDAGSQFSRLPSEVVDIITIMRHQLG